MPLVYDLKKDLHFQQGIVEGEAKRDKQVIERGIRENYSIQQMAKLLGVSEAYVRKIADELKK